MSISERRIVTLNKLKNDVQVLRKYARFVLVLDEHGDVEVVDNEKLFSEGSPYASLIVVVGPQEYKGEKLEETVLLEIAYNRARPYLRIQFKQETPRININARQRVRTLEEEEIKRVYPYILQCMRAIVLERRMQWSVKEPWSRPGSGGNIERGIRFSVHKSDEWLYRQMLVEHIRFVREWYMHKHEYMIYKLLKRFRFVRYSYEQLVSYAGVRQVLGIFSGEAYTRTLHVVALLSSVSRRVLVEGILVAFGKEVKTLDQEARVFLEPEPFPLQPMEDLRCYVLPERTGGRWKQGGEACAVVEIGLERRFRERYEIIPQSREQEVYSDEIPF